MLQDRSIKKYRGDLQVITFAKFNLKICFLTIIILIAVSCGSSNDGFFGTAFVKVNADPTVIDVGDASFVTIDVDDVDDDNFFLKVRFPTGVQYLEGSSTIRVQGSDSERNPDLVFTSVDSNHNYLVYFLSRAEFGDSDGSRVTFDLVGFDRISKGLIEVDADIDDPNIDNNAEFDQNEPKFDAEASTEIQVRS
jgi:hypothetical protein